MSNLTRRQVFGLTFGALLPLLDSGCGNPTVSADGAAERSADGTAKPNVHPLRIAIIQDKSLSTAETRTPQLQMADLDPLIELLGQAGGELAVGIIHDLSSQNFVRLRIDAPPAEPVARAKADNPLDRRKQDAAFRKQMQDFKAQEQAWREEMQLRIGDFQANLEPVLSLPANARRSPVWDAVHRTELFLTESQPAESVPPHRYTVLITDGMDDVGARPVPVRSGAKVFMVNGAGQLGALAVLQPQRFESTEAAFRSIAGSENK